MGYVISHCSSEERLWLLASMYKSLILLSHIVKIQGASLPLAFMYNQIIQ